MPEQIHYISTESYDKNFPKAAERGSEAIYFSTQRAAYINVEAYSGRLAKYHATLHEATHSVSAQIDSVKKGKKKITSQKCGYGTITLSKEEKGTFITQFIGFNEAVTEKMTKDVLQKHKDEIFKEFNISEKEKTNFTPSGYDAFIKILDAVIKKTAEKTGTPEEETWGKIKKGYFDGRMMHLREIERALGGGALRMLAAIGEPSDFVSQAETAEMILIYFQSADEKDKEKIAKLILSEKEFEKYQKRK